MPCIIQRVVEYFTMKFRNALATNVSLMSEFLCFLNLKFSHCRCTSYVETWVDISKCFRIGVILCLFIVWINQFVNKFMVNL